MSHRPPRSLASSLVVALVCGCIQPVVLGPGPGPGPAPATAGSAPAPSPALPGGTARGGVLQRGQTLEGVLSQNESHDYQVDLRAGESIHVQVTGATELGPGGERCTHWDWEWRSPTDRWVSGNPGPVEPPDGPQLPRTFEADLSTSWGVDEQLPGRWTFRLHADAGCHRIRYRLVSR